jgi:hypothetical protein
MLSREEDVLLNTLMPITILLDDFTAKHEYLDNSKQTLEDATHFINKLNIYLNNIYHQINPNDEEMSRIAHNMKDIVKGFNEDNRYKGSSSFGEDDMGSGTGQPASKPS